MDTFNIFLLLKLNPSCNSNLTSYILAQSDCHTEVPLKYSSGPSRFYSDLQMDINIKNMFKTVRVAFRKDGHSVDDRPSIV